MSAQVMEMTPLEYLAASKREQAAGNHVKAAALMWKATQATFAALADAKGLKYKGLDFDGLLEIAKALEADGSVRKFYYRSGLSPGSLLRDHVEMDVLESYQLELAYETAEHFIRECLNEQ